MRHEFHYSKPIPPIIHTDDPVKCIRKARLNTELREQAIVKNWLLERGITLFTATAQSSITSWSQINRNIAAGVRRGIPDLVCCLPTDKTQSGRNHLLFIEMKRVKRSRTSPEQQAWYNFLNSVQGDISAYICFGHESAIGVLESLLKPVESLTGPITDKELLERLSKK